MKFAASLRLFSILMSLTLLFSGCGKGPAGTTGIMGSPDTPDISDTAEDPDLPDPEYGYGSGQRLPDTMPVLSVSTEDGAAVTSNLNYLSATLTMEEPLGIYNFTDLAAEIRCRGNYTYFGVGVERKSYRIRFETKQDPLGLGNGSSKNWVLLANWCDRSMLRDAVAATMADLLNFSFNTDFAYVELYLNGEYRGVYLLAEHPSINSRRLDLEEKPDTLDSDYLIELDMRASKTGVEGVDYFVSDGKQYVVKNDGIHPDALEFLADYFDQVNEAVRRGDREAVEALVDIDSFVDMVLLQEFALNWDVGFASLYFVKNGEGKLELTFPWDFDLAFGNYSILGNARWDIRYIGNPDYAEMNNANPMFWRLLEQDWFADLLSARFEEVGADMVSAGISEAKRILAVYSDEFERNYQVFPTLGTAFTPIPPAIAGLTEYRQTADQLIDWIQNRYDYLYGIWCPEGAEQA
ncbi:MAG: CotH kinase family protein [Eubacteriales bacterium]